MFSNWVVGHTRTVHTLLFLNWAYRFDNNVLMMSFLLYGIQNSAWKKTLAAL